MGRNPGDPATVRTEIELTRQRMSGTLDQIEEAVLRKKEKFEETQAEIRRQLDVGARIREKPLAAAGIVLGAGLLVGFLTGGSSRGAVRAARQRGTEWEKRARRLLDIARSQEDEIEELRIGGIRGDLFRLDDDLDDDLILEEDDFFPEDDDSPTPDDEYAYLSGDELYPLDPELDDETIEYPPAGRHHDRSWRDRLFEFAANSVESVLDSLQSRD